MGGTSWTGAERAQGASSPGPRSSSLPFRCIQRPSRVVTTATRMIDPTAITMTMAPLSQAPPARAHASGRRDCRTGNVPGMARVLMTVSGEFEADIVRERLAEAGIQVLIQGEGNPRAIASGARDICVEDDEL